MTARPAAGQHRLEVRIGRILGLATLAAVVLLAVGSGLLLLAGSSPLEPAPAFDPVRLLGDLARLHPAGLLWLGMVVVVTTPILRVGAALVGYVAGQERAMALISGLIILIIVAGAVAGVSGGA